MSLLNAVEDALRRWDALERSLGEAPVIDFDCAPSDHQPRPFHHRFAALEELTRLRRETDTRQQPVLTAQVDAHLAYLSALLGQQYRLDEYLWLTQGCAPHGWTPDYLEFRASLARDALGSLGISWDKDTWARLQGVSERLPAADISPAITEYARKYEASIRQLVETDAEFTLTIEDVEVDAYWSYWLDGAGHNTRLRINRNKASFTRIDGYRFALHEVLGHALQYASLTAHAESHSVDWLRILAVHCPHQVMFEGLAQVLPWIAAPEDNLVCVRTRVDHFMNLIRGQLHILINSGARAADCRNWVRCQVPWWTDEEITRELYDRSRNPQLRSYLWSYPAGMDWFVRLLETGGTTSTEILRAAYRRPLTPSELHELWPTGPVIGGNQ